MKRSIKLLALLVLVFCAIPVSAAGLSIHRPPAGSYTTQAVPLSTGFSPSDGVGTWNTCTFVVSPTGVAQTMYGTSVVDSSGQATGTNHAMDGTTWTDISTFTISSDGKIQMDGVDWGVMSYDRNTAIGYGQQDGSVGLTICVRAGSGYTLEDAIGHWRLNALQVGSVWTGWTAIDADLDATGAMTGTIVDSDGGSNPFSAQVSISPDGELSAGDGSDLPEHGFMSTNGQFFIQVAGALPSSGAERIDVGMLGGGDFITDDLAGEWHFYTITKNAMLFEGMFTAQPDGSMTGTNHDLVHDITNPISGTIGVTPEGVISFDEASSDLEGQGTLSLDRSTFIFAFTDHAHEDDMGFIIGTKHPTDVSTSIAVTEVDMDWGNGFRFSENLDAATEGTLCDWPAVQVNPMNFQTPPMPPTGASAAAGLTYGNSLDSLTPSYSPGSIILPSSLPADGNAKKGEVMPELDLDGWTWPTRTGDLVLRARFEAPQGDLAPMVGNGALSNDIGFSVSGQYSWWGDVWMTLAFATIDLTEPLDQIPAGYYNREPVITFGSYNGDEEQQVMKLATDYDPAYPVDLKVVVTPEKVARGYVNFNTPGSDWVLVGEQQIDWWPDANTGVGGCGTGVEWGDTWIGPYVSSSLQYIDVSGPGEPIPVDIVTTGLADGMQGAWYDQTLEATGGSQNGIYFWELVSGQLPPGLSMQAISGQISGYPLQEGAYRFTVRATDPFSQVEPDEQEYTLIISPNLVQEITGTWGFHSIAVSKTPGSARSVYGTFDFSPDGTCTVTKVLMDGTYTTSSFSYDVQPDGTILADGRPMGTLSYDNKRILSMRFDSTQGVLTLLARLDGEGQPTQYDAEGSWAVHSYEIGPTRKGWRYTTGNIDEWGDFQGTRTLDDGSSVPYLATASIDAGILTIQEPGNPLLQHSVMSPDGLSFSSLMGDTASPGTARLDIGIRTGGDFIAEDLEGKWWIYGISSMGNVFRAWASVSADGSYTGETFDSSDQITEPISGTMSVTPDGQVTITDSEGSNAGHYTLSMNRAFFAGTFSDGEDRFMMLGTKRVEPLSMQADVTRVYMNWGNGFSFDDPLDSDTLGTPCGVDGLTVPDACFTHPTLDAGGFAAALYAFDPGSDRYPPAYEPGRLTLKSTALPFGDNIESQAIPSLALNGTPWVPQTQDMELRATFENIQGYLATPAGSGCASVTLGFAFEQDGRYLGDTMVYLNAITGYFSRDYPPVQRGYYNRALIADFGCWVDGGNGDAEHLMPLEGYDLSQPVELKLTISPSGLSKAYLRFEPSQEWISLGEGYSSLWPGALGWASGCYWPDSPSGIEAVPFVGCDFSYEDFGAPLVISPSEIPNAVVGVPYSQQFMEEDGWGNRTWSLADGTLPPGLTISSDGMLSGTPTQAGTFQFTIRVEDGRTPPVSAEREYTLCVYEPITVNDAKAIADSVPAMLSDVVVTRKVENGFYVEQSNRSAGMLIENLSGSFVAEGWVLEIMGSISTTENGEKALRAQTVRKVSDGSVRPIGMNLRSLGGTDFAVDPGTPASGQRGVEGGAGTNNIGLLVKTWGRATQIDPMRQYFYIEDGSAIFDGTQTGGVPSEGVRVEADPFGLQPGDYVTVTGISSCFRTPDDQLHRAIRAADTQVHFPAAPIFILGTPDDGAPTACQIIFSTVRGAAGYRLYKSTNGVDYSPTSDTPSTMFGYGVFQVAPPGNTYYRVKAVDAEANESPFGPTVYARVLDQKLDMWITQPWSYQTGVSLAPMICWQSVAGAVSYGVEVHRDLGGDALTSWGALVPSSIGNCVAYGRPGSPTYVPAFGALEPGTNYWVYTYAVDSGNWAFATGGDQWFTTQGSDGGGGDNPPPPPM